MVQVLNAFHQPISLEAFLRLPETKPASEYYDGYILQKTMPQGKHSTVQRELTLHIERGLKSQQIARAFPELRCTFGGQSIVPDVSIFTWIRIPRDPDGAVSNQFMIPPDWVIEILSPGQSHGKTTKKILHCLKYGTQMGWLIDPDEATIFIYGSNLFLQVFDRDTLNAPLPVPVFASDLEVTVQDMINWLLE
jgi:Uma2 family endonuclease